MSEAEPRAIVLEAGDLAPSESSLAFVGDEHGGGAGISFFLFDAPAGRGPDLHRHASAEVFIVQEGEATFTLGDREQAVRAGQVVVVPPGVAHGFKGTGRGRLRQVDIHLSPRFVTEWLPADGSAGAEPDSP